MNTTKNNLLENKIMLREIVADHTYIIEKKIDNSVLVTIHIDAFDSKAQAQMVATIIFLKLENIFK